MTNDTGAVQAASNTNTQLMNQYQTVGVPALRSNLQYATNALNAGTPQYVQNAYSDARTGAMESSIGSNSAREQLTRNLSKSGGGAYLSGVGAQQQSNANALTNETSHIATTQALTGLEQRNKLLNVLQGGGATGTNLSAGFGQLTNEGLGQSAGANNPFGAIMGGASALSSIYAQSQITNAQAQNALAFNPNRVNPTGSPNAYGGYQAGGGNVNLVATGGNP